MDDKTMIAIIALVISTLTSFTGLFLTIRTNRETNRLAKASRRTLALNCLSDEELALWKVKNECESLHLLVDSSSDKLGVKSILLSETERILEEARQMLSNVEKKRSVVAGTIEKLRAAEIEVIIAESYHGRILAEAQLNRTMRSREDTIKLYLS